MASVADWSQQQGYHYHCIGDRLFDWVTPGLRAKLQDRKPILADLARLRWIESELAVRGGLVVWIDADTLTVDPLGTYNTGRIRFSARNAGFSRWQTEPGAPFSLPTTHSWVLRQRLLCWGF